jgi:hypothetical protein
MQEVSLSSTYNNFENFWIYIDFLSDIKVINSVELVIIWWR